MQFPTGAIREVEGKPMPLKNLSFLALNQLNNYLAKFNHKYDAGNWKLGQDVETYLNAAMRHLIKHIANEYEQGKIEPEEDHLIAALFNLMGAVHERERNRNHNTEVS